MPIRCDVLVLLVAGVCSCEARRTPPAPAPVVADRIVVPSPGLAPGAPARLPTETTAVKRSSNPPLFPNEGSLAIEAPPDATPGMETTAHLRLTANAGYEINEKFHYKLTLEPTPGVTLAKTVFTGAAHDAERLDEHELAIAMKLTPDQPGDFTIHGKLDFAVCKIDSQCLPKTMPVAVQVAAR